ncbi:hypothetical protein ACFSHQ_09965 [Gemmobacter lanyuensis]
MLGSQIPDGVHPTANLEIGKDLTLGSAVVRPFLEAQVGVEDYLRVGADVILGRFGRDGLFTRDTVTGHRVLGISALPEQGISLTLGGDVARVFDSVYLPDFGPATLKGTARGFGPVYIGRASVRLSFTASPGWAKSLRNRRLTKF